MVFSYSIKYLPTLLYTVWTFGKGNRLLSFGYYALNKNEGIPYGSLKIARKKTFLQWIEGFFFGMEISWPVSSGSSKSAFFLQKLRGSVHFLKRISNIFLSTYLTQQSFSFESG